MQLLERIKPSGLVVASRTARDRWNQAVLLGAVPAQAATVLTGFGGRLWAQVNDLTLIAGR
jgi:hypothetical protein